MHLTALSWYGEWFRRETHQKNSTMRWANIAMVLKEESGSKEGERKIIQELLRQRLTGCQGGWREGKKEIINIKFAITTWITQKCTSCW